MGFLNKLFGFRWSLYIVQNGNELVYAMHEHSALRMVGYVMSYFANGGKPVKPWRLYLNFNHKHQKIRLGPEHFTLDGQNVSPLLIQQIEVIDPGWKVKSAEPVFEEAATKKRIKIQEDDKTWIANISSGIPELTFYRVMDEVFGTQR